MIILNVPNALGIPFAWVVCVMRRRILVQYVNPIKSAWVNRVIIWIRRVRLVIQSKSVEITSV